MVFFLVLAIVLVTFVQSGPTSDKITNLPGLTWETNYDQYSGYLSLENGHNLHYWFVESQNDPKTDPVVLWLNGGPGCSSLDGLLYEHGPFNVYDNGSLYENNYAWNLYANVIYLEAPIDVGFSYGTSKISNMNDNTTAQDNYNALLKFFEKFPEYEGREFYVTGESYGGVYVPTLVYEILNGNNNIKNESQIINIQGFAVGNGVTNDALLSNSLIWFAYHHGLVSETLWNSLLTNCCKQTPYNSDNCNFASPSSIQCEADVGKVLTVVDGGQLNVYNLYGPCLQTTSFSHKKYIRSVQLMEKMFRFKFQQQQQQKRSLFNKLKENPPCIDATGADIYLNRADVRNAIHIPSSLEHVTWTICSDTLHYESLYDDLSPFYKNIFNMDDKIWATIYNGDIDMACNFLGDEWFSFDLGYDTINTYREWTLDNNTQVAGWTIDFERFHFVTVRGAGHMVPQWAPPQALKMFKYFLNNKQL